MDFVHLKAIKYRDEKFPESRYEDGDIDIEQLYDGITEAYEAGYHKCQKEAKLHYLGLVEDYLRETYISAIGETDYCIDDMIEHFREHFNIA